MSRLTLPQGRGYTSITIKLSDLGKSPPSRSALIFSPASDFSNRETAVLAAKNNHLIPLLLSVKLMVAGSVRFCTPDFPPSLQRDGFLGNIRNSMSDISKAQALNTSNSRFSIHLQMSNMSENSS